ncbi:MAG: hypothetical protein KTR31_19475 [Myxococcales bacterium]|nr:hypothetical protein [Myxococcales bacterium]
MSILDARFPLLALAFACTAPALLPGPAGSGPNDPEPGEDPVTETGNPKRVTGVTVEVGFTSPTGVEASGAVVTASAGTAVLRDIELDLPSGQDCTKIDFELSEPARCIDDAIVIEGPLVIDLYNRTSQPDLSNLALPEGTYRRIDMRFDPDSAPDEVSLRLLTEVSIDDVPTMVELALEINEDARFESPNGIFVSDSSALLALLDLDVILADTPLVDCASTLGSPGSTITIDDDSNCRDVEEAISDALKESFDLDDGDDD